MSYQSANPYLTNIVPLYNVASPSGGGAAASPDLINIKKIVNYATKNISINTINSYTNNGLLQLNNNTAINGNLSVNSYLFGPDNTGKSLNTCKRFIVSTPTTTVSINTKVGNAIIANFNIDINNVNALYINSFGDASFTKPILAPAFTVVSDVRYKTDIGILKNTLSSICQIQGKHYLIDGVSSMGFIAQDIDDIIPSAVDKKNADKWSINYISIIPYLVESIKELNLRISTLEGTR
jgi:hypothetical protein